MGYKQLKSQLIAAGRLAGSNLGMIIRNNFISHESRITELESQAGGIASGTMIMYGGSSAPSGFLLCDGSVVSRATYADLFAIIGTSFNEGGEAGTDFRLPDLRGRTPVGVGAGAGLTTRAMGDEGGEESHVISEDEMPAHNHTVTDPQHGSGDHQISSVGINPPGAYPTTSDGSFNATNTTSTMRSATTGITLANTGSSEAHENMHPSLVVNFLIKI